MPRKSGQNAETNHINNPIEQVFAPETFAEGLPLPRMIVFDLDYTLWPFWVDTHVTPPLKVHSSGIKSTDRHGESFTFYRDIPSILTALKSLPQPPLLSTASRTHAPDLANTLLKQLIIPPASGGGSSNGKRAIDFFDYMQIFPGDKKTHFQRLREKSGVPLEEMLFFDDEVRNRNVEALGVTMCLVRDGVTRQEVDRGVREWRKRREERERGNG